MCHSPLSSNYKLLINYHSKLPNWPYNIGKIIKETANAMWESLTEPGAQYQKYLRKGRTSPVGVIDGKHVAIQSASGSGSLFFKNSFSIVLLGVCNGNYEFNVVDTRPAAKKNEARGKYVRPPY